MFMLERGTAFLFRTALRRGLGGSAARVDQSPVLIRHGKNGWLLHARHDEFALLYSQPGPAGKGVMAFPANVLGQFEGRSSDPVELTLLRPGYAVATWNDRGNEQRVEFELLEPEQVPIPPELPRQFSPVAPNFLAALHEAGLSTAHEPTKYALNCILLRGRTGEIVGSDSKQLFVQGGFQFPFQEEVMIPRLGIFGMQPFRVMGEISIGRTEQHVVIQVGPWMIVLTINRDGRFPDCGTLLRRAKPTTTFQLHPTDAEALLTAIETRLRGPQADDPQLTLDLSSRSSVRLQVGSSIRQIELTNSQVTGNDVCLVLSLDQFLRMLKLQFHCFEIRDPDKPIVARDGQRTFLAMPLAASSALPPITTKHGEVAEPISPVAESPPDSLPATGISTAVATIALVRTDATSPQTFESIDVLAEAEGLRDAILRAADHAGRLLQLFWSVCREPNVVQNVRNTFRALTDRSAPEKQST